MIRAGSVNRVGRCYSVKTWNASFHEYGEFLYKLFLDTTNQHQNLREQNKHVKFDSTTDQTCFRTLQSPWTPTSLRLKNRQGNEWVQAITNLPPTPLHTGTVLQCGEEDWGKQTRILLFTVSNANIGRENI